MAHNAAIDNGEYKKELSFYSKERLKRMLTRVGQVRQERLTESVTCMTATSRKAECVVVEVNEKHLWYRVRFLKSGVCQCYKLPQIDSAGGVA